MSALKSFLMLAGLIGFIVAGLYIPYLLLAIPLWIAAWCIVAIVGGTRDPGRGWFIERLRR